MLRTVGVLILLLGLALATPVGCVCGLPEADALTVSATTLPAAPERVSARSAHDDASRAGAGAARAPFNITSPPVQGASLLADRAGLAEPAGPMAAETLPAARVLAAGADAVHALIVATAAGPLSGPPWSLDLLTGEDRPTPLLAPPPSPARAPAPPPPRRLLPGAPTA